MLSMQCWQVSWSGIRKDRKGAVHSHVYVDSELGAKTPTAEHCSKRLGRVDFTRREGGEGQSTHGTEKSNGTMRGLGVSRLHIKVFCRRKTTLYYPLQGEESLPWGDGSKAQKVASCVCAPADWTVWGHSNINRPLFGVASPSSSLGVKRATNAMWVQDRWGTVPLTSRAS